MSTSREAGAELCSFPRRAVKGCGTIRMMGLLWKPRRKKTEASNNQLSSQGTQRKPEGLQSSSSRRLSLSAAVEQSVLKIRLRI